MTISGAWSDGRRLGEDIRRRVLQLVDFGDSKWVTQEGKNAGCSWWCDIRIPPGGYNAPGYNFVSIRADDTQYAALCSPESQTCPSVMLLSHRPKAQGNPDAWPVAKVEEPYVGYGVSFPRLDALENVPEADVEYAVRLIMSSYEQKLSEGFRKPPEGESEKTEADPVPD